MSEISRDVVMMARIRNEERWIGRNLERTLAVADKIVLWDDGSTDRTPEICGNALAEFGTRVFGDATTVITTQMSMGWVQRLVPSESVPLESRRAMRELHFLNAPFRGTARSKERVNEIRDKNLLWMYAKSEITFRHVLCLDGDEMLSYAAIRGFPGAIAQLEQGVDIIDLPFIYVWDSEDVQRVDGIYGAAADGGKRLRFPRLFTIDRLDEQQLFDNHFAWGGNRGGFHCGSIPQQEFFPSGHRPSSEEGTRAFLDLPVVHFGYIDRELRERKFKFYNEIDPDNEVEGRYLHIIGEPNHHAPGPLKLTPWQDA